MTFEMGVVFILLAYILWQESRITQLLDRLMARNFPEYKSCIAKKPNTEPVSMSDRQEYEKYCKDNGIIPEKEEA